MVVGERASARVGTDSVRTSVGGSWAKLGLHDAWLVLKRVREHGRCITKQEWEADQTRAEARVAHDRPCEGTTRPLVITFKRPSLPQLRGGLRGVPALE